MVSNLIISLILAAIPTIMLLLLITSLFDLFYSKPSVVRIDDKFYIRRKFLWIWDIIYLAKPKEVTKTEYVAVKEV